MCNKNTVLDLCEMSIENTKLLNQIFDKYRQEYTKFVDDLSNIWGQEWHWWITNFASRNIFLSQAYRHICIVFVAIENIKSNENIKKILVPEIDIAKVLRRYIEKGNLTIKIEVSDSSTTTVYGLTEKCWNYLMMVLNQLKRRRIIRKETKSGSILSEQKLILIETDVFSTCFDSGEYRARDFGNILDYTEENIYFLPYLFLNNDMSLLELVRYMNGTGKTKFLFRENYLKFIDYIKAFTFPFWCIKFCRGSKVFHHIDVTEIVNADIMKSIRSNNSLYGILNYYFIRRIKEENIPVKSLIGWYEGQPSSLGLFKSFHKNYKGMRSVGYEGCPLDIRETQFSPSCVQRKFQVVPQTIGIIGEVYESTVKQFDKSIGTIITPAFRLQGVFEHGMEKREEWHTNILVALPYDPVIAAKIIKEIDMIRDILERNHINVLFKNHPANQLWRLQEYGCSELSIPYIFISDSFNIALQKADIVLTCVSATSFEAILSGKKVIIMVFPSEIGLTRIPLELQQKIRCAVVYDAYELGEAIVFLKDTVCEPLNLNGNRYLTKADRKSVNLLLGVK